MGTPPPPNPNDLHDFVDSEHQNLHLLLPSSYGSSQSKPLSCHCQRCVPLHDCAKFKQVNVQPRHYPAAMPVGSSKYRYASSPNNQFRACARSVAGTPGAADANEHRPTLLCTQQTVLNYHSFVRPAGQHNTTVLSEIEQNRPPDLDFQDHWSTSTQQTAATFDRCHRCAAGWIPGHPAVKECSTSAGRSAGEVDSPSLNISSVARSAETDSAFLTQMIANRTVAYTSPDSVCGDPLSLCAPSSPCALHANKEYNANSSSLLRINEMSDRAVCAGEVRVSDYTETQDSCCAELLRQNPSSTLGVNASERTEWYDQQYASQFSNKPSFETCALNSEKIRKRGASVPRSRNDTFTSSGRPVTSTCCLSATSRSVNDDNTFHQGGKQFLYPQQGATQQGEQTACQDLFLLHQDITEEKLASPVDFCANAQEAYQIMEPCGSLQYNSVWDNASQPPRPYDGPSLNSAMMLSCASGLSPSKSQVDQGSQQLAIHLPDTGMEMNRVCSHRVDESGRSVTFPILDNPRAVIGYSSIESGKPSQHSANVEKHLPGYELFHESEKGCAQYPELNLTVKHGPEMDVQSACTPPPIVHRPVAFAMRPSTLHGECEFSGPLRISEKSSCQRCGKENLSCHRSGSIINTCVYTSSQNLSRNLSESQRLQSQAEDRRDPPAVCLPRTSSQESINERQSGANRCGLNNKNQSNSIHQECLDNKASGSKQKLPERTFSQEAGRNQSHPSRDKSMCAMGTKSPEQQPGAGKEKPSCFKHNTSTAAEQSVNTCTCVQEQSSEDEKEDDFGPKRQSNECLEDKLDRNGSRQRSGEISELKDSELNGPLEWALLDKGHPSVTSVESESVESGKDPSDGSSSSDAVCVWYVYQCAYCKQLTNFPTSCQGGYPPVSYPPPVYCYISRPPGLPSRSHDLSSQPQPETETPMINLENQFEEESQDQPGAQPGAQMESQPGTQSQPREAQRSKSALKVGAPQRSTSALQTGAPQLSMSALKPGAPPAGSDPCPPPCICYDPAFYLPCPPGYQPCPSSEVPEPRPQSEDINQSPCSEPSPEDDAGQSDESNSEPEASELRSPAQSKNISESYESEPKLRTSSKNLTDESKASESNTNTSKLHTKTRKQANESVSKSGASEVSKSKTDATNLGASKVRPQQVNPCDRREPIKPKAPAQSKETSDRSKELSDKGESKLRKHPKEASDQSKEISDKGESKLRKQLKELSESNVSKSKSSAKTKQSESAASDSKSVEGAAPGSKEKDFKANESIEVPESTAGESGPKTSQPCQALYIYDSYYKCYVPYCIPCQGDPSQSDENTQQGETEHAPHDKSLQIIDSDDQSSPPKNVTKGSASKISASTKTKQNTTKIQADESGTKAGKTTPLKRKKSDMKDPRSASGDQKEKPKSSDPCQLCSPCSQRCSPCPPCIPCPQPCPTKPCLLAPDPCENPNQDGEKSQADQTASKGPGSQSNLRAKGRAVREGTASPGKDKDGAGMGTRKQIKTSDSKTDASNKSEQNKSDPGESKKKAGQATPASKISDKKEPRTASGKKESRPASSDREPASGDTGQPCNPCQPCKPCQSCVPSRSCPQPCPTEPCPPGYAPCGNADQDGEKTQAVRSAGKGPGSQNESDAKGRPSGKGIASAGVEAEVALNAGAGAGAGAEARAEMGAGTGICKQMKRSDSKLDTSKNSEKKKSDTDESENKAGQTIPVPGISTKPDTKEHCSVSDDNESRPASIDKESQPASSDEEPTSTDTSSPRPTCDPCQPCNPCQPCDPGQPCGPWCCYPQPCQNESEPVEGPDQEEQKSQAKKSSVESAESAIVLAEEDSGNVVPDSQKRANGKSRTDADSALVLAEEGSGRVVPDSQKRLSGKSRADADNPSVGRDCVCPKADIRSRSKLSKTSERKVVGSYSPGASKPSSENCSEAQNLKPKRRASDVVGRQRRPVEPKGATRAVLPDERRKADRIFDQNATSPNKSSRSYPSRTAVPLYPLNTRFHRSVTNALQKLKRPASLPQASKDLNGRSESLNTSASILPNVPEKSGMASQGFRPRGQSSHIQEPCVRQSSRYLHCVCPPSTLSSVKELERRCQLSGIPARRGRRPHDQCQTLESEQQQPQLPSTGSHEADHDPIAMAPSAERPVNQNKVPTASACVAQVCREPVSQLRQHPPKCDQSQVESVVLPPMRLVESCDSHETNQASDRLKATSHSSSQSAGVPTDMAGWEPVRDGRSSYLGRKRRDHSNLPQCAPSTGRPHRGSRLMVRPKASKLMKPSSQSRLVQQREECTTTSSSSSSTISIGEDSASYQSGEQALSSSWPDTYCACMSRLEPHDEHYHDPSCCAEVWSPMLTAAPVLRCGNEKPSIVSDYADNLHCQGSPTLDGVCPHVCPGCYPQAYPQRQTGRRRTTKIKVGSRPLVIRFQRPRRNVVLRRKRPPEASSKAR